MAKSPYESGAWRAARLATLERDGYRCQIRGPRCQTVANEADHVVPVADGGAPYDLANLRAACKPCNIWRANVQKRREGWRRSSTRIVLVVGPPGAGKSTYAVERAGPRDVVVDYDVLSVALGGGRGSHRDVTRVARNAVLREVRRGEVDAPVVWLVSANPEAESMFPFHEVVVVDPGREEVLARCGRERPASFASLVDDWYRRRGFTPANSGASRAW